MPQYNTSATGGFLIPYNPQNAEDVDLDQQLQPILAGITGLNPTLVRRKWQASFDPVTGIAIDAPDPPRDVNWLAFGTINEDADTNPTLIHDGAADQGQGATISLRNEEFEVLVSFYGPNSASYAAGLRDGFGISQNREAMRAAGIGFVKVDRITKVPDLKNGAFIRRADLPFRCRRVAARTYPIRNVLSVAGTVTTDQDAVAPL